MLSDKTVDHSIDIWHINRPSTLVFNESIYNCHDAWFYSLCYEPLSQEQGFCNPKCVSARSRELIQYCVDVIQYRKKLHMMFPLVTLVNGHILCYNCILITQNAAYMFTIQIGYWGLDIHLTIWEYLNHTRPNKISVAINQMICPLTQQA